MREKVRASFILLGGGGGGGGGGILDTVGVLLLE